MLEAAAAADHLFDTCMVPYNFCLTASCISGSAQSKVHLTYSVQFLLGDNLQLFLSTDPYSKVALANSISLVAVDGNNYTVFNANISCLSDGLLPCSQGLGNSSCADMDPAAGKPLYTVCKHRGKVVFWDMEHPTMGAWEYIINLYATKPSFLLLADAPSILEWSQNDAAVPEACCFAYASACLAPVSGLQLPVRIQGNLILISQADATEWIQASAAQIIQPTIYLAPGEIAVHGINNVLFPPGIMY
ncbi:unnamed protein product [Sphagnum balticum]